MSQADELIKLGLDSCGYRYVNIDDGFFGGRDRQTGRLLFHKNRFPNGLKPVVDHIHSLNLKAGIYSDAGANTCGNYWDHDTIAHDVGLYGHERQDCELLFSELGFDFIKVDFCGGDPKQNYDSLYLNPKERYTSIRKSISEVTYNDVKMNICRWNFPGTWAAAVASSWRISQDIEPKWASIKNIINQNLYLSAYVSPGHYNDMDMLELGRGLSDEEERTHFGMWCMMSSPLLIGCNLTKLPENTLKLLKNRELISINQDSLGLQAYVAKHYDNSYVLVKDIEHRNGLTRAVAFYNPTDSAKRISINFNEIELDGIVMVQNLFDSQKTISISDSISIYVAPHNTEIFKLKADKRIMRNRHEAETAYLTSYQELVNPLPANTAFYKKDSRCSGGMKVVNGGKSPDNDIIFKNVFVPENGKFNITVVYIAPENGELCISANGANTQRSTVVRCERMCKKIFQTNLKKGSNTIRIYSDNHRIPEIDYIEIAQI